MVVSFFMGMTVRMALASYSFLSMTLLLSVSKSLYTMSPTSSPERMPSWFISKSVRLMGRLPGGTASCVTVFVVTVSALEREARNGRVRIMKRISNCILVFIFFAFQKYLLTGNHVRLSETMNEFLMFFEGRNRR